jgi:hypothetical protein
MAQIKNTKTAKKWQTICLFLNQVFNLYYVLLIVWIIIINGETEKPK